MSAGFFAEPHDHSRVKALIVAKYFPAWAKIVSKPLKPGGFLAYLDLFCGPGRYGTAGGGGAESTPLLVTRAVVADPRLRRIVRLVFNDKSKAHTDRLEQELRAIPGIKELTHKPTVYCGEVGGPLARTLASLKMSPTFSFVDPFGYKGLTQDLIGALIKDWGSECVLFFNDAAIRRALANPKVAQPVAGLFGEQRARLLGSQIEAMPERDRSRAVVGKLQEALLEAGARYVLPFLLTATYPRRRHFHVVFVTKHMRGYELMRQVMRSLGRLRLSAAGHWEIAFEDPSNPWLFEDAATEELVSTLPQRFAGRRLSVRGVYEAHQSGTPFVLSDYKAALRVLAGNGSIQVTVGPGKKWRAGSFPDHLDVSFPPAGG